MLKKRAKGDDAEAIYRVGCYYLHGSHGLQRNFQRGNELLLRAAKLGESQGYYHIGCAYWVGRGVDIDLNYACHYFQLAAMGGDVTARHNIGVFEECAGNTNTAVKHFVIAAGAGGDDSLKKIQGFFLKGHATKDEFEKALRTHQAAKDETKSDQREAAAAYYHQRRPQARVVSA